MRKLGELALEYGEWEEAALWYSHCYVFDATQGLKGMAETINRFIVSKNGTPFEYAERMIECQRKLLQKEHERLSYLPVILELLVQCERQMGALEFPRTVIDRGALGQGEIVPFMNARIAIIVTKKYPLDRVCMLFKLLVICLGETENPYVVTPARRGFCLVEPSTESPSDINLLFGDQRIYQKYRDKVALQMQQRAQKALLPLLENCEMRVDSPYFDLYHECYTHYSSLIKAYAQSRGIVDGTLFNKIERLNIELPLKEAFQTLLKLRCAVRRFYGTDDERICHPTIEKCCQPIDTVYRINDEQHYSLTCALVILIQFKEQFVEELPKANTTYYLALAQETLWQFSMAEQNLNSLRDEDSHRLYHLSRMLYIRGLDARSHIFKALCLPCDHPLWYARLESLASCIYLRQKDSSAAEAYCLRALDRLPSDHPFKAKVLNNMGNIKMAQRKLREAHLWFTQSLKLFTQHFGPNHPELRHVQHNLSVITQVQEKKK